jgi:hypothetical protein
MRSRLVLLATVGALAVAPTAAQADFPEQPGSHVANACEALINDGSLLSLGLPRVIGDGVKSDVAEEINGANYIDACQGG